jgi:hypothetical protein
MCNPSITVRKRDYFSTRTGDYSVDYANFLDSNPRGNKMKKFDNYSKCRALLAAVLLFSLVSGCGGKDPILGMGGDILVGTTNPAISAVNVCPDQAIAATFLVPSGSKMDPDSINKTTFTVTGPDGASVKAASVELAKGGVTAVFTPKSSLVHGDIYTATILGGADGVKDLASPANEMASNLIWTFEVGSASDCAATVDLGLAKPFGIAATAGVTNTPTVPLTHINGDVIMDPDQTCNAVNVDNAGGFGLCGGSAPTINGQVITNTFPDVTTSAAVKADLNAAYLSITPSAGPPAAGSLDGGTPIAAPTNMGAVAGSALVEGQNLFYPGVYTSITSIMITDDLTLDAQGDPNASFIFQSASTVGTAAGAPSPGAHTRILLINGASASNVWWQAGSSATLGLYTKFQGNILAAFDVTMETGSTSCGRLMAGAWVGGSGAFVFDSNVVSVPGNGC